MHASERAEWRKRFQECVRERGLRLTQQRVTIANVFLASKGHLNIEELYRRVRARDPRVGYATIYRTLRLLKDCGLAVERNFDGGASRYEPIAGVEDHHDHLICSRCGTIVEFEDERVSARVAEIARELGFRVDNHEMKVYGLCQRCAGAEE